MRTIVVVSLVGCYRVVRSTLCNKLVEMQQPNYSGRAMISGLMPKDIRYTDSTLPKAEKIHVEDLFVEDDHSSPLYMSTKLSDVELLTYDIKNDADGAICAHRAILYSVPPLKKMLDGQSVTVVHLPISETTLRVTLRHAYGYVLRPVRERQHVHIQELLNTTTELWKWGHDYLAKLLWSTLLMCYREMTEEQQIDTIKLGHLMSPHAEMHALPKMLDHSTSLTLEELTTVLTSIKYRMRLSRPGAVFLKRIPILFRRAITTWLVKHPHTIAEKASLLKFLEE